MSDEVFDLLLGSGEGVNKMYHLTEDYHFGVAVSVEPWVIELDSYAVSLGGVYQRALDYALREFSSRKNGIASDVVVQPELMDEALQGVITFGRAPMSGYFCKSTLTRAGTTWRRVKASTMFCTGTQIVVKIIWLVIL